MSLRASLHSHHLASIPVWWMDHGSRLRDCLTVDGQTCIFLRKPINTSKKSLCVCPSPLILSIWSLGETCRNRARNSIHRHSWPFIFSPPHPPFLTRPLFAIPPGFSNPPNDSRKKHDSSRINRAGGSIRAAHARAPQSACFNQMEAYSFQTVQFFQDDTKRRQDSFSLSLLFRIRTI